MHVVVCSVIPPLFLPWQLDFASPRSHYCMNVTECFVFPSLLLSLQMAFASPRSHYCTSARPHVDDDCFVTKHTFLIHFGDPIPLQWDNSTIYLKHCGIYAFDASKKQSLPIWPRFSISLRSWDTGSATPCEDDHVTKKIRPNPSN